MLAGIVAPDKQRMNLAHGRSHPSTEPSLPGKGFGKRYRNNISESRKKIMPNLNVDLLVVVLFAPTWATDRA